jgi:cytochrome c oxidase subunit II
MLPFIPRSSLANGITHLFTTTLVIAAIVFVLVTGLVLYVSFRYRAKRDGKEPKQVFGNRPLEMAWTVTPALVLGFLLAYTVVTMNIADPSIPEGQQPDVIITGHQWWWEVRYLKSGVITANELHLPVGKRLLAEVVSSDVIHSFWVPQISRKIDATPGYTAHLWLEADQPGVYQGSCAEYCGTQHAWMRIQVFAESKTDFDAWQKQQLVIPTTPLSGDAAKGAVLFQQLTCSSCHTIAGTPANAQIGPNLTHVASRPTIGGGVLDNSPASLTKWIANPQVIKPGVLMPNLELSITQINELVAYLEAIK